MSIVDRNIKFSRAERTRIHVAARALNTTQHELCKWLILHGLDEIEGLASEVRREMFNRGSDK